MIFAVVGCQKKSEIRPPAESLGVASSPTATPQSEPKQKMPGLPAATKVPKEELAVESPAEPPAIVRQVFQQYLTALQANDVAAMETLVSMPFLAPDLKRVKNQSELTTILEQLAATSVNGSDSEEPRFICYRDARKRVRDEKLAKLLPGSLDDDDWIVAISPITSFERLSIWVKYTDGNASVVAGPMTRQQTETLARFPDPADSLLTHADRFEVYSLNPLQVDKSRAELFHGWPVLGKTAVLDQAARQRLCEQLRKATEENPGMSAFCFIPRHGLRLFQGEQVVDLVICFQCSKIETYRDDKLVNRFLTTITPEREMDAILTAAGVELAQKSNSE